MNTTCFAGLFGGGIEEPVVGIEHAITGFEPNGDAVAPCQFLRDIKGLGEISTLPRFITAGFDTANSFW